MGALTLLSGLVIGAVSASNLGVTGYQVLGQAPFADAWAAGTGTMQLSTDGKAASLTARFSAEGSSYELFLDRPTLVRTNAWVHGGTGLGSPYTTPAHAAAAVWGVGRVVKDGKLLTARAQLYAAALDQGTHADDSTHRLLPRSRPGDGELELLALGLPADEVPGGFVQVGFDDVKIDAGGVALSLRGEVPTVSGELSEAGAAAAPPAAPEYGGLDMVPGAPGVVGGALPMFPQAAISRAVDAQAGTGGSGAAGAGAVETDVASSSAGSFSGASGVSSGALPARQPEVPAVSSGALPAAQPEVPAGVSSGALPARQPEVPAVNAFPTESSPGIPATPAPSNAALPPAPQLPATGLLQTPAPLNAAPAVPLPGTPAPLNATPAAPVGPR